MTIVPILNIGREKMGAMGILPKIYDGVYVFICTVYYYVLKKVTQHTFVYDSHFSKKQNSECCGAIVDKISYVPICVLKGKDRRIKGALNNMIRKSFDGN